MQVKVFWSHHFWGDYHATIHASFPKDCAHVAQAFGERFLGQGFEVKPYNDELVCGIFTKKDEHTAIAERLQAARIEEKCDYPNCGEIHVVGDTAHSIDRATPVTIEVGHVDHPGQKLLFKEEP